MERDPHIHGFQQPSVAIPLDELEVVPPPLPHAVCDALQAPLWDVFVHLKSLLIQCEAEGMDEAPDILELYTAVLRALVETFEAQVPVGVGAALRSLPESHFRHLCPFTATVSTQEDAHRCADLVRAARVELWERSKTEPQPASEQVHCAVRSGNPRPSLAASISAAFFSGN